MGNPAAKAVAVMVVDDHELFRRGLGMVLDGEEDFAMVAEASDGLEAIDRWRTCRPDVIVMNVRMPRCSGIEATRAIKAEEPAIHVLGLSISDDGIKPMAEAGASGYLFAETSIEQIADAIRTAMSGEPVIPTVPEGLVDPSQVLDGEWSGDIVERLRANASATHALAQKRVPIRTDSAQGQATSDVRRASGELRTHSMDESNWRSGADEIIAAAGAAGWNVEVLQQTDALFRARAIAPANRGHFGIDCDSSGYFGLALHTPAEQNDLPLLLPVNAALNIIEWEVFARTTSKDDLRPLHVDDAEFLADALRGGEWNIRDFVDVGSPSTEAFFTASADTRTELQARPATPPEAAYSVFKQPPPASGEGRPLGVDPDLPIHFVSSRGGAWSFRGGLREVFDLLQTEGWLRRRRGELCREIESTEGGKGFRPKPGTVVGRLEGGRIYPPDGNRPLEVPQDLLDKRRKNLQERREANLKSAPRRVAGFVIAGISGFVAFVYFVSHGETNAAFGDDALAYILAILFLGGLVMAFAKDD